MSRHKRAYYALMYLNQDNEQYRCLEVWRQRKSAVKRGRIITKDDPGFQLWIAKMTPFDGRIKAR